VERDRFVVSGEELEGATVHVDGVLAAISRALGDAERSLCGASDAEACACAAAQVLVLASRSLTGAVAWEAVRAVVPHDCVPGDELVLVPRSECALPTRVAVQAGAFWSAALRREVAAVRGGETTSGGEREEGGGGVEDEEGADDGEGGVDVVVDEERVASEDEGDTFYEGGDRVAQGIGHAQIPTPHARLADSEEADRWGMVGTTAVMEAASLDAGIVVRIDTTSVSRLLSQRRLHDAADERGALDALHVQVDVHHTLAFPIPIRSGPDAAVIVRAGRACAGVDAAHLGRCMHPDDAALSHAALPQMLPAHDESWVRLSFYRA
jgi:hypothetical protein